MEASGLRICGVCREELPLVSFYGHQQRCISCKRKPKPEREQSQRQVQPEASAESPVHQSVAQL